MVPNTSELLPEPDTPVNTVSRRFGISTSTSLRLFSRAPCTRINSWLSAAWLSSVRSAAGCGSALVAMLIVSPSVRRGPRGPRRRRPARSDQLRGVRPSGDRRATPSFPAGVESSTTSIPSHVHEAAVVALEGDGHRLGGAVAVLGDDEVGLPGAG